MPGVYFFIQLAVNVRPPVKGSKNEALRNCRAITASMGTLCHVLKENARGFGRFFEKINP